MNSSGWKMLLAATLSGALAVGLALQWMQGRDPLRHRVLVARADLQPGSRLQAESLESVAWPRDSLLQGTYADPSELAGRVVVTALQRGEPILASRLAPVGAKGGLSAVVPEGKRAITVRVNDVVGVAGFALPGTFVDVMVNTQADGSSPERDRAISKIVLNRIRVMAIAQESDRDATAPKVVNAVTLEVTPGEAEALDLARSVGTLSLVLRNPLETEAAATRGITKAELLGPASPPAPAAPLTTTPPAAPLRRMAIAPAQRLPAAVSRPDAPELAKPAAPPDAPAPVASATARAPHCVDIIRGLSKVNECF
jgi:pilus assembly protein CpaB